MTQKHNEEYAQTQAFMATTGLRAIRQKMGEIYYASCVDYTTSPRSESTLLGIRRKMGELYEDACAEHDVAYMVAYAAALDELEANEQRKQARE